MYDKSVNEEMDVLLRSIDRYLAMSRILYKSLWEQMSF